MLTLTTDQTAVKNATSKTVLWLFDITPVGGSTLHWSTQDISFAPTSYDYVPASTDYAPASTDYAAASSDYVPASTDYAPASTDYAPASSDYAPASSDYAPASSDYAPASSDYVPASSDYVPASSDYTPESSDYVPASSDYVPASYASGAGVINTTLVVTASAIGASGNAISIALVTDSESGLCDINNSGMGFIVSSFDFTSLTTAYIANALNIFPFIEVTGDATVAAEETTFYLTGGVDQIGTSQVGTALTGTAQVGTAQVGTAQVGTSQIGTAQVGTAQVGTAQVGTAQVGTAQVGTAQVGTARVGTIGSSTDYTFSVWPDSFPGVTMHRSRTELGALPMPEVSFTATNALTVPYAASYFKKASVVIKLAINNVICRTWKMTCSTCQPGFKSLTFDCFGFLKDYMANGLLPVSPKVTSLYPEYAGDKDDCAPVIFGTSYTKAPCVIKSSDNKRYYLIGLSQYYTVFEVHAGVDWAAPSSTWSADDYTFDISIDQVMWGLLAPRINDTYLDGTSYSTGFSPGGQFLPILVKYCNSSLVITNPADIIASLLGDAGVFLKDMGNSGLIFYNRGIVWNGGWSRSIPSEQFLCQLLSECHGEIDVRDKVYVRAIQRASVATISASSVLRMSETSTWGYSLQNPQESDGGTVSFSASGTPNDVRISTIVAADSTTTNYSTEVFALDMIHDSILAQKLAKIRFQRKFLVEAQPSWESPLSYFDVQPGDVVTISGDDYGGAGSTYDVLVDEMTITKGGTVKFTSLKLSAMSDFDTLTFSAVTPATPVAEPETLPPLIEAIHDPNKLTPTEKINLKRDFDSFTAEKSIIDASADTAGVSRAAYDAAYTALETALGTAVTTGLMDLETVVDGAAINDAWVAYTDARTSLQQLLGVGKDGVDGVDGVDGILNFRTNPDIDIMVLGCPFDGSNGSTVFSDLKGHSYTVSGSPALSSTVSAHGGTSLHMRGPGYNDLVIFERSGDWYLGDTYTLGFYLYCEELPVGNTCRVLRIGENSSPSSLVVQMGPDGSLNLTRMVGEAGIVLPAESVAVNVLSYFEFDVLKGVGYAFKDGSLLTSLITVNPQTQSSLDYLYLGYDNVGTVNFQYHGFIDELFIIKGKALHTADFTPPAGLNDAGRLLSLDATIRSTSVTPPSSGSGAEMSYYAGSGYLLAYDRTNDVYKPLIIGGSSINFNASTGNYYFGTVTGGASAVKNIFIQNGTAPTSNPVGGVVIWAEGGALKARGTSGTVTTIAAA